MRVNLRIQDYPGCENYGIVIMIGCCQMNGSPLYRLLAYKPGVSYWWLLMMLLVRLVVCRTKVG